jgi:hypothetical protein
LGDGELGRQGRKSGLFILTVTDNQDLLCAKERKIMCARGGGSETVNKRISKLIAKDE